MLLKLRKIKAIVRISEFFENEVVSKETWGKAPIHIHTYPDAWVAMHDVTYGFCGFGLFASICFPTYNKRMRNADTRAGENVDQSRAREPVRLCAMGIRAPY